MDPSSKILIVTALILLIGGVITGVAMAQVRREEPHVSKYLRYAHLAAYGQAPLLLGLIFAFELADLSAGVELTAVWLVSLGALTLFAKDVINWRTSVTDEFSEKGFGYVLGSVSGVLQVGGLVIVTGGVLTAL